MTHAHTYLYIDPCYYVLLPDAARIGDAAACGLACWLGRRHGDAPRHVVSAHKKTTLAFLNSGLGWARPCTHLRGSPPKFALSHCTRQLQDNYKTTTRQSARQPTRQLKTSGEVAILG